MTLLKLEVLAAAGKVDDRSALARISDFVQRQVRSWCHCQIEVPIEQRTPHGTPNPLRDSRSKRTVFNFTASKRSDSFRVALKVTAQGDIKNRKTLEIAIESIESAVFLTAEQKRDIFFNNAARFLQLSQEQVDAMHGGN